MKNRSVMDQECIHLCEAMNLYPGITTFESCCGHGKKPFRIWFDAESLDALPDLIYYFVPCHSGCDWPIHVKTDCAKSPVSFFVEGPTGKQAYQEAERIAKYLDEGR